MNSEEMIAKLEGGKLANFGNGYDGSFFAQCAAQLTQLREQLAKVGQERDWARDGRKMWMECAEYAAKDRDRLAAEVGSLHIELASVYAVISGKQYHMSDCATSCAPAERPARCDCDAPVADLGLLIRQLRKGQHFTVDSMACLMREAATAIQAQLAQLTAAQEENKRLKEEVDRLSEKAQQFADVAVDTMAELAAAQQSAQVQYRAGMERAAEIIGYFAICQAVEATRNALYRAAEAIRAELSKGEGKDD